MTAGTSFAAFEQAYAAGKPQVVSRRLVDDLETPVSAYLKLGAGRPYSFLYESVEGGAWRGRYSIVALAPDLVWRCRGEHAERAEGLAVASGRFSPEPDSALQSLRRLVAESAIELPPELPPMAAGLFGVFGYDMVRLIERLGAAGADPLDLPDAVLARPSVVAIFDSVGQEIVLATPVRPSGLDVATAWGQAQSRLDGVEADLGRPAPARPKASETGAAVAFATSTPRERFEASVVRAKDYIAAGDIFQVVLSQRFSADFKGDPFSLYRSLRRTNPSPFLFFLDFGDFQLVGSSPEILVRRRDGKVTIRPIAGTRRRGATPAEDAALEAELLADPKERAEHLMLLDLGRNDVGRVSTGGSVRVTEQFVIERYSHVMHIVSNVEGDADPALDAVDVLLAALPAGTLSGAPKVRAMEIIDELEGLKRGVAYGGAAGYISANGSVDTCIVLRTALIKDGMLHVQAGAGIVADSDPTSEHDETLQKSAAIRRAAEEAWRFS